MPLALEFVMVLFLAAFGALAAAPVIIIPHLLAPKKPNPIKSSPFECGQVPSGEGKVHFMMQYYAYLLMFVVFDVMSIFLFSWALAYSQLGLFNSLAIVAFLGVMLIPLGYAMKLAVRGDIW